MSECLATSTTRRVQRGAPRARLAGSRGNDMTAPSLAKSRSWASTDAPERNATAQIMQSMSPRGVTPASRHRRYTFEATSKSTAESKANRRKRNRSRRRSRWRRASLAPARTSISTGSVVAPWSETSRARTRKSGLPVARSNSPQAEESTSVTRRVDRDRPADPRWTAIPSCARLPHGSWVGQPRLEAPSRRPRVWSEVRIAA
jgi:hypothetical protein